MILKCNCRCMCQQKLLTNTSQERKMCTGCFIGNCKGIRLGIKQSYIGGRFEITKRGQYTILGNKNVKDAYPQNLNEIANNPELEWNALTGSYEIKNKEEPDA